MTIRFANPKAQYDSLRSEIEAAVLNVLSSGTYVLGPEVEAFEREFAAHCGAEHAIAASSGTSALHLALLAADVGPGDEVITTPLTFVATVAAIEYTGARAVLADIDPATFNIDPALIEKAITPNTKAIIPVHLYGQPADMESIAGVARTHGLTVVEDAAQAHGAGYNGKRVGAIGDIGCFSFYPTKNLGALGEGGIVTTSDAQIAERVRRLRDWGQEPKSHHIEKGYNHRMDAIQGAVLRVKLRHLDSWNDLRRERARWYDELLADSSVAAPQVAAWSRHVYHLYVIRSGARDDLRRSLVSKGIETGIHYPAPVHLQPAYADLGYGEGAFPLAEAATREILSLPMYPELTRSDVEQVAAAVLAS